MGPCHDSSCDYYATLLMPLYLDSKFDVLHRHPDLIGQVKFIAHGKNVSGKVQWTYQCSVLDPKAPHKISCDDAISPDPKMYFKAYLITLSDASINADDAAAAEG